MRQSRLGRVYPQQAARNVAIHITSVIDYSLRYQKCWGAVYVRTCSADTATGSSPTQDDSDAWNQSTQPLYLDVLPTSLDGLWQWSEISNPDQDDDGLPTSSEASVGTNPAQWDTDGDGLSDGWEWQNKTTLGTDPTRRDSDGDGLADRHEVLLGTAAASADSDKDGLSDGDEVCRVDTTGGTPRFVGGWQVTKPNETDYWTCSNPLDPDADPQGQRGHVYLVMGAGRSPASC